MSDTRAPSVGPTLFGHPAGLTVLFLTETAAYFSAFGMQALLVLYMVSSLDFDRATASTVFGLFVGGANLSPLLGGWIADRFIGQHRAVTLGAVLMALGHGAMLWDSGLFPGLALVALGNGFFVTSLVTRIGALYAIDDPRRDRAYMIYYLGINVGSFLAPLCCGWLAQRYGWHAGFGAAAVVMVMGLIFYLALQRFVPRTRPLETGGVARSADAVPNIAVLIVILGLVVLFRLGYEQTGNSVALWIDHSVDRSLGDFLVPTPWFQSLNPLFIFLISPFLAFYWRRRDNAGRTIDPMRKMTTGAVFAAIAFAMLALGAAGGIAPVGYVVAFFLCITIAELHVFPIGLAMVARFSSSGNRSTMMGLWYFVKFLAGTSAGLLAAAGSRIEATLFFMLNVALALIVAVLMLVLHYWLRRLPSLQSEPV